MIWNKTIYDTLTTCATICDESATEFSKAQNIEDWYRCIFLNLDCADVCRQVAMLYVRGSENTRLLAKTCIEVCEKCADETCKFVSSERCQQIRAVCLQTIQVCTQLLNMNQPAETASPRTTATSLFYGIDLRETLYN